MADEFYYECNAMGDCRSPWGYWGRWAFLAFTIFGFILFAIWCAALSARRRRFRGLPPRRGTSWLAPKPRFPGPGPGPQYYPPPPPQGAPYMPPPYTPSPQYTGIVDPHVNYYAPPPGPPPTQVYEMHPPPGTHAPHVPLSSHPTGSSYVQSNNPFQPRVATPPAAHIERKE